MNPDVVLKVIGYAVVPLAMAWLGNHLASKVYDNEPRKRRVYRSTFILLVALGVIGTWFVEWRSDKAHSAEIQAQQREVETLRSSLEAARISGESGQAYLRGQLDSVNRTLGAIASNSDPKQTMLLLKQMTTEQSTLKRDALTVCSRIDAWGKKYPPPPAPTIPGKPTQQETDAQNAYFQKMNTEYYQNFSAQALGVVQRFGAKGLNVAEIERAASYGYLPSNLCIQLRALATQLDDQGNVKH